jgi:hypothetical protein
MELLGGMDGHEGWGSISDLRQVKAGGKIHESPPRLVTVTRVSRLKHQGVILIFWRNILEGFDAVDLLRSSS